MKTKFILHGGESSRRTEKNERFFKRILDITDKMTINILCVYFARPEHRWQESFYEDRLAFEEQAADTNLYIEIAKPEDFLDQLNKSDLIFINGGFKGFLKESLSNIKNLQTVLQGKTVVGISAGANILSKYYYSQGVQGIREGLGLLPIKVFCHYSESSTDELVLLERYKENLPTYKIEEEEFIEI